MILRMPRWTLAVCFLVQSRINTVAMGIHDNSRWLSLCRQGQKIDLVESDRISALTRKLSYPDVESPSLIMFVGNKVKSMTLQEVFGVHQKRYFKRRVVDGEVHLHVDRSTISTQTPTFLIDVKFSQQGKSRLKCVYRKTRRHPLRFVSRPCAVANLCSHLLLPFVDTICFFSNDLGGFREIATVLAFWLKEGGAPNQHRRLYPRVIIISQKIPHGREDEGQKAFLLMLEEETDIDPKRLFSAIEVVTLSSGKITPMEKHSLKSHLIATSQHIRKLRQTAHCSFSMSQLGGLTSRACMKFGHSSALLTSDAFPKAF